MIKSKIILSALLCLSLSACLFDSEDSPAITPLTAAKSKTFQNEINYNVSLSQEEINADLKLIAQNNDALDTEGPSQFGKIQNSYKKISHSLPQVQAENCQSMSKDLNTETTVGEKGSGVYSHNSAKFTAANGVDEVIVCQGQSKIEFRTIIISETENDGITMSLESNILTNGSQSNLNLSGDMSMEMESDKFQLASYILITADMKINQSTGRASGTMEMNGNFFILQDKYRCAFKISQDFETLESTGMNCDLTHNGEKVGTLVDDQVLDIDGNIIQSN